MSVYRRLADAVPEGVDMNIDAPDGGDHSVLDVKYEHALKVRDLALQAGEIDGDKYTPEIVEGWACVRCVQTLNTSDGDPCGKVIRSSRAIIHNANTHNGAHRMPMFAAGQKKLSKKKKKRTRGNTLFSRS